MNRLVAAAVVAIALLVPGPAASAAPDLPRGTSHWKLADFDGVDCADCPGYLVLKRVSASKYRVANLREAPDGSRRVSCGTIRRRAGMWVDPYGTVYRIDGSRLRRTEMREPASWWVEHSRVRRSAVARWLRDPSSSSRVSSRDRATYRRCVG